MIFTYFDPSTLAKLALVSRALYAAVQEPLYSRPVIETYTKLKRFIRTIYRPVHRTSLGALSNKRISHLMVELDIQKFKQQTRRKLTATYLATLCGTCPRFDRLAFGI